MSTRETAASRPLLSAERHDLILSALAGEGKVLASELSARLGVSLDTVRRDLQELAAAGALRRVHGGALPSTPTLRRFADRRGRDTAAKAAIASAAVALVHPGDVVLLGGGTTLLEFARRLPDTLTVVGPDAVEAVREVRADVCVLGVCSLHPVAGLTLLHRDEAQVERAMIEGATRVVTLTGAEKLGSAGPFPVAPLGSITHLVTDASASVDGLAVYRELGIEVVQA